MAVDSRGFATGFAQGFGMMDQYQTRQRQAAMQEQQMGLQQERWQYQQEQDALNRERQAERDAQTQSNWEATHALQQQTTNANIENNRLTRERQAKQDAQTDKENQYKQDQRTMQSIYANIGAGNLAFDQSTSQTIDEIYKRNPSLVAMPLKKTLQDRRTFAQNKEAQQATIGSIQKLFMPDAEITGQDAQAIMSANVDVSRAAQPAATDAVAIVERVFDPNDDFNENSPQALGAFNYIFGDLVGEGKQITGVFPGSTPGTISLDLDTPNAKGVPMTVNRGTEQDGDNEVLEIPVEKAIDALKGFKALSQEFSMNPDAAQKALRFARTMGLAPKEEKPKFDTVKFREETMSNYNEAYQKIISDTEATSTDESKAKAVSQLRSETASILGIHPDNLDIFRVAMSQGNLSDELVARLRTPQRTKSNASDNQGNTNQDQGGQSSPEVERSSEQVTTTVSEPANTAPRMGQPVNVERPSTDLLGIQPLQRQRGGRGSQDVVGNLNRTLQEALSSEIENNRPLSRR